MIFVVGFWTVTLCGSSFAVCVGRVQQEFWALGEQSAAWNSHSVYVGVGHPLSMVLHEDATVAVFMYKRSPNVAGYSCTLSCRQRTIIALLRLYDGTLSTSAVLDSRKRCDNQLLTCHHGRTNR